MISVCLTTYRRALSLPRTLDSLLAQTERDFELLIADDASPDDTERVCRSYAARDPRIRYLRNPINLGMPGNLNRVIAEARGEYVANLHDGDVFSPDLLVRWKRALDEIPEAPFVFNAYLAYNAAGVLVVRQPPGEPPDGRIPGRILLDHFAQTATSCVWGTVMARRSAYQKAGPFDACYGAIADVDMWLTLARGATIAYVAEPLIELAPREPGHAWEYEQWRFLFWTAAIYRKHLGRALAPRMQRARFARALASLIRRRRFDRAREGLAMWADAPDPFLRRAGRLFGCGARTPDWYRPALWEPLSP